MAHGTQVIQTYTAKGIAPLAKADRAMVACQKAGMAPKSRQGGGIGAVHWLEDALVNHNFTLAVADPITAAGEIVPLYLRLMPAKQTTTRWVRDDNGNIIGRTTVSRDLWAVGDQPARHSLLSGATLGEGVKRLVRDLGEDTSGEVRTDYRQARLQITLGIDESPWATVSFTLPGGDEVDELYLDPRLQPGLPGLLEDAMDPIKDGPAEGFIRTTKIPFAMIEMLADLLADTLAHQASLPLSPSTTPARVSPKATGDDCAVSPARENTARSTLDQACDSTTAKHKARGVNNPEATCMCGSRQSERESLAGRRLQELYTWARPPRTNACTACLMT